jgi:hypothetical protein
LRTVQVGRVTPICRAGALLAWLRAIREGNLRTCPLSRMPALELGSARY